MVSPTTLGAESVHPSLVACLEAILFASPEPCSLQVLALAVSKTEGQVEQALEVLGRRLEGSGLMLAHLAGGFQLATRPEFAPIIAGFLKPQRNKLGKSLLEVLAIVAYRQPVTCADVERVRGVQSDYAIRGLVERGLIREVGRKAAPGRPVLYGSTAEFLHQFNLRSLEELPPIDGMQAVLPYPAVGSESAEPLVE